MPNSFWEETDFTPYDQPYEQGGYEPGGITGGEPGGYAGPSASSGAPSGYSGPASLPAQYTRDELGHGDVRDPMFNILKATDGTAEGMRAAIAANPALFRGATLGGKNGDKLDFGNGNIVDVRGQASAGKNLPQWGDWAMFDGHNPGGSDPSSAASGAVPNALGAAMGGGGTSGGGSVNAGRAMPEAYKYKDFDPSSVDMSKDPGVAFRMSEAQKAMQNSAASRGTLFSGGFAKALNDRTQDYASQEYNNAFSRALGVNQANNQGGLSAYNANVGAALGQGNLDLGYQNSNNQYSLGLGNLALGNKTADQSFYLGNRNADISSRSVDNSYALGQGNLGLGWANYGLNADGQNFDQGYRLAGMGQNSAAQSGSYGSSYAANQGNTYMAQGANAGNAQLAGANAWGQALGNGINNAAGAYYYGKGR
jgi:hypothetical protein